MVGKLSDKIRGTGYKSSISCYMFLEIGYGHYMEALILFIQILLQEIKKGNPKGALLWK